MNNFLAQANAGTLPDATELQNSCAQLAHTILCHVPRIPPPTLQEALSFLDLVKALQPKPSKHLSDTCDNP